MIAGVRERSMVRVNRLFIVDSRASADTFRRFLMSERCGRHARTEEDHGLMPFGQRICRSIGVRDAALSPAQLRELTPRLADSMFKLVEDELVHLDLRLAVFGQGPESVEP